MVRLVENRAKPILEYVTGKTVLEIGCIGMGKHDIAGGKNFIAGYVKPISKRWIGIDINEEGIKQLRENNFDVRLINAEKPFDLEEQFDIVLAEEVMEHLSDHKTFLENVYRHMKDDGLLIISTPNPISPSFLYQRLFGKKIRDVSIWNHTHWQTHETLTELLSRYGLKVVHYEYIHPMPAEPSTFYPVVKILWKLVPTDLGRNLLLIASKSDLKK